MKINQLRIRKDTELFFTFRAMRTEDIYQLFLKYPRVVKDTRLDVRDSIYFSLKGGNFNGNAYAREALEKGAAYAVVDEEEYRSDERMILVEDALACLQDLARFHRKTLGLPILALTGSNGKTTTKELIHSVLSKKYNCLATAGNLNNHIGVPLTLLSLTPETEMAVIEMGANHPGEIQSYCDVVLPDYGYITNFGRVHLEGFGSLQGVIQSKTELYRHLESRGKKVFINASDPVQMERSRSMRRVLIGGEGGDCKVEFIDADPYVRMSFEGGEIRSQLIGAYNYGNMAAAACIGRYFEVDADSIREGIESYVPSNNRSQVIRRDGNMIIMDAYNANPNSMEAAIENLNGLKAGNKVAILGDMFEIGKDSDAEHQRVAERISSSPLNEAFLIGENFAKVRINDEKVRIFPKFEDFSLFFSKRSYKDTTFLIKASRGMALERVLDLL